jgi:hemerythrin-like domain-containing protein
MPEIDHDIASSQLSRWWQEHSELDQLIEALTETCDGGSGAAASAALEDLAGALEGHLTVEEEVYFPLVEHLRPELESTIRGVRLAHTMLRARIDQLREHLAADERQEARRLLGALLELFRSHEAVEGQLIADLSDLSPR